jgi:hypothetical protein
MLVALLDEAFSVIEYRSAMPICGEDFCENCGDCLHCYADDPCPDGGGHFWAVDFEDREAWAAAHT